MFAQLIRRLPVLLLAALPLVVVVSVSCTPGGSDGGPADDKDGGSDPISNLIPCESRDQCPNAQEWDCAGVCLKLCAGNDACELDEYCANGFCRAGCRDSNYCDVNTNEICIDGTCTPPGNATTCGSKCDCSVGQVCKDSVCQAPPGDCGSSADCARAPGAESACNDFACNGFTSQCFYPNAPPCVDAEDCLGRPGCTGGDCICNATGQCVIPSPCTLATEVADCGADAYCTAAGLCDALPACTDNTPCTPLDMLCNLGLERCGRPIVCATANDCAGSSPSTYCDLTLNPASCTVPTCLNGGTVCAGGFICSGGACVPDTTMGNECTSHSQCNQAPWPNTEYCYLPSGQTMGVCTAGCPNNTACPSGQYCDGNNTCVVQGGGGTTGAAGEPCDSTGDCQFGLICKLTGTCEETCGQSDSPCSPATDANCCDLTGYANCNPGLIFSFCAP